MSPCQRAARTSRVRSTADILDCGRFPSLSRFEFEAACGLTPVGLDIHLSVEEPAFLGPDAQRHFGIECADVDGLRIKLKTAGVEIDDGRPAPWKRFFVRDPFGNRIEIHEAGGLRA